MAYECIILKPALSFLEEQASDEERREILEAIDSICEDPYVDGIRKFYFPAPPAVFTICKDRGWWIIYYSPREDVLHVINIGRAVERPDIRRSG